MRVEKPHRPYAGMAYGQVPLHIKGKPIRTDTARKIDKHACLGHKSIEHKRQSPHLIGTRNRQKDVFLSVIQNQPIRTGYSGQQARSEEHTSELQSLMRNSYAVFCLKKKNKQENHS